MPGVEGSTPGAVAVDEYVSPQQFALLNLADHQEKRARDSSIETAQR
jgi:hypothetical protein